MFCWPLNTAPSGMNAHVIARRGRFVMFAPAPWIVIPLWNEQLPAFIAAWCGVRSRNDGYMSKIASRFFVMPGFSNVVARCEPGKK